MAKVNIHDHGTADTGTETETENKKTMDQAKEEVAAENVVGSSTGAHELEVYPENVSVSKALADLRDRTTEQYRYEVKRLADAILADGQIQPTVVREVDGELQVVAGQRRLDAVTYLRNQGHDVMLRVTLESKSMDDDRALRLAMAENIQRKNFTPIELANNIQRIRAMHKWTGTAGTKRVAEFLHMDKASVTQAERLLTLPADVQKQVHTGTMTPSAALELTAAVVEKQAKVVEVATKAAKKEADKKAVKDERKSANGKAGALIKNAGNAGKVGKDKKEADKPVKPAAPVKIQGKHIRKAIKEIGAAKVVKTPKLSEVRELVEQLTGPSNPKLLTTFASKFLDWMLGKATEKQVVAAWDDVGDYLPDLQNSNAKPGSVKRSAKGNAKVKVPVKATVAKAPAKVKDKVNVKVKGATGPKPAPKQKLK